MRRGALAATGAALWVAVAWAAPPPEPDSQTRASARQAGWVVDAQRGCWVWQGEPAPGVMVSWEGACPRGPATGAGRGEWRWVEDREGLVVRFEGVLRDGRLYHGRGVLGWPDGRRYEGEVRHGLPEGRGVFHWPNGDRYEGEFLMGRPHGDGVLNWANGDRYEGGWRGGHEHGRGVWTGADGARYEGAMRDGRPHGRGVWTWPDGVRHEGELRAEATEAPRGPGGVIGTLVRDPGRQPCLRGGVAECR